MSSFRTLYHTSLAHRAAPPFAVRPYRLARIPEHSATPGAVFHILTNGVVRRGIPVWSKLPEPQRWQLVSFIKSLGVVPKTPEKEPD